MDEYRRAAEYARMHNVKFSAALDALTADQIIANADRFDSTRMDHYRRVAAYAQANKTSFENALEAVPH
jgi:hypothetical protein